MNFSSSQPTLTIASWITLSRLLSVPIILGLLSWQVNDQTRLWAAVVFGLAAFTDWLDGYVARHWQQESDFGKLLDPLIDKLVVMAPLLMFVEMGEIPAWGVFLLFARELLISVWRSSTNASVIGANFWGKAKTVVQMVAILAILLQFPYAIGIFWIGVLLTIYSGIIYVLPIHHS